MNLAICSNRDLFIFEFVLLAGFIFQTLINDEFLKMSCFIKKKNCFLKCAPVCHVILLEHYYCQIK